MSLRQVIPDAQRMSSAAAEGSPLERWVRRRAAQGGTHIFHIARNRNSLACLGSRTAQTTARIRQSELLRPAGSRFARGELQRRFELRTLPILLTPSRVPRR